MANTSRTRNGKVYKGSITKMDLKESLDSSGQKSCVLQVVKESSSGCVKKPKNMSHDQCFQWAADRRSILEISHPKTGAKATEKKYGMGKAAVNFYCGNGIYKIAGKSIQTGNGAGNCAVKHRFVACLVTKPLLPRRRLKQSP